jgi:multiple sugar transport system substrate-binding protein
MLLAALLAWGVAMVTAGCQSSGVTEVEANTAIPATRATTVRSTEIPTVQASPTITVTATPEDSIVTLTFWTVEPISPRAQGEAGEFIERSLVAFEDANPDIRINLLLKKASGKGGVLDFLRTAHEVAPSVLPDVVVMNATDLTLAAADNLLQPLNGRLNRSIVQDLLPAARKLGTVNDKLVGVPLAMEMEHIAYNTAIFSTPPLLWTDVLSSSVVYLFPAQGVNGLVNDATLAQYFSAGGKFLDDQGHPTIDERVLYNVLDFYQRARDNGVLTAQVLEVDTTEELWPMYLAGEAGIAQISVRQYLTDRDSINNTLFAPVPVQNGRDIPVAVSRGWALALVTSDPNRQSAALSLIEWFLSTDNNVTWNTLNRSIPTRDTAYQQLAGEDPYWIFLIEQLNTAQPPPAFTGYDRLGRIIQQAVVQVISGEATPEEATATAIDALAQ